MLESAQPSTAPSSSPRPLRPGDALGEVATLRAAEARHRGAPLMERAGAAAAALTRQLVGANPAPVLVLAGPGNNGGDGLVMARRLRDDGHPVVVVAAGQSANTPPDARAAMAAWRAAGGQIHTEVPAGQYAMAVDALFGIGLSRPPTGAQAALIERLNRFPGPVLALDLPSGVNADRGVAEGVAVRASHTLAFIAAPPGLLHYPHGGELWLADLGVHDVASSGAVNGSADYAAHLMARARDSHKGCFGSLAVIGGAPGMTGAALLAARAGLHLGAGRILVGLLAPLAVDPQQPELMLRSPASALEQATCAVIGPGLGTGTEALALLSRLASADFPLLFDADALNLLALHPVLAAHVTRRQASTLLTPHPAEAARLLGCDTATVQADRLDAARHLAMRFNACVALKGHATLLAHPDGRWRINQSGNPGLASGGTGDVLAGIGGAFLAQGWDAWSALCAAVHLHGIAADDCVAAGRGPVGLYASELIAAARTALNRAITARHHERLGN